MTYFQPIQRRTFLRGVGAAIALPWLEAMAPRGLCAATNRGGKAIPAGAPPRRIAFIYVPNGVHVPDWFPKTDGRDFEMTPILNPLEPFRDLLTVISGLAHTKARANGDGAGDHARSTATFLTGAQAYKTAGKDIKVGMSVDQIAAQEVGRQTRLPSLELGVERGRQAGNCDSGYSCAYSSNISWRTPSQPATKEINPRLVFQRLFGKTDEQESQQSKRLPNRYQKSILDLVQEDARSLRGNLGQTDRRKLDEYLTGLRELERRVDAAPSVDLDDQRVVQPRGIPEGYVEHVRLMCDMMTLAFQTDTTRISTFMFANAGSNRSYRSIGVREGHHSLSHHGGNKAKQEKIGRINRLHIEQLAYLLEKMKSVREGEASLLDNTLVVYGCSIADGNRHNHDHLPVLLAGRGGGHVRPSGHVKTPRETPLMNLYLTMLDSLGVVVDQAGDSTGRLDEIRNA